jgi:hypothetical protein
VAPEDPGELLVVGRLERLTALVAFDHLHGMATSSP